MVTLFLHGSNERSQSVDISTEYSTRERWTGRLTIYHPRPPRTPLRGAEGTQIDYTGKREDRRFRNGHQLENFPTSADRNIF